MWGSVSTPITAARVAGLVPVKTFATVAAMVADGGLEIGQIVLTRGYTTAGDGRGAPYRIVASATGTDDGNFYINLTGVSGQAEKLMDDKVLGQNDFGTGNGGNTLIRNKVAGATRIHVEPNGNIDSGVTSKLDFMLDPYDDDAANYRILNLYTQTGDPHGTGEGAICAINAKGVGTHWGNWPSINIGFQDLGADAVAAKVWYGDHGQPQHYTPNQGGWRQGKAVTAGDYVSSNNDIFVAASSGTCGATAPTHTTGTVSDGGVDWTFVWSPHYTRVRPVWLFGPRDAMPILGHQDTNVQFALNTMIHYPRAHQFMDSSDALANSIGIEGNAGAEYLYIENEGGGATRWMPSLNMVQDVGIARCSSMTLATDGDTTPSVAGVTTLKFANVGATLVTALDGGVPNQRVRLISTNSNTTLKRNTTTSGGIIRNTTGADIVLTIDGALDLERDSGSDFWRVVGAGY